MRWRLLLKLRSLGSCSALSDVSTENDPITRVDLIRHGEVVSSGIFCAPPEEPLSECGWQQLVDVCETAVRPDVILSSPYRRCAEFAERRAQQLGCNLVFLPAFQEMDFGDWTGCQSQQLWQQHTELFQSLWQQPLAFTAPQGESMSAFVARVTQGWQSLLAGYAGQRVWLFSHGGVIRVLLGLSLAIPYEKTLGFELGHGTATRLRIYADGMVGVYGVGVERLT